SARGLPSPMTTPKAKTQKELRALCRREREPNRSLSDPTKIGYPENASGQLRMLWAEEKRISKWASRPFERNRTAAKPRGPEETRPQKSTVRASIQLQIRCRPAISTPRRPG